MVDKDHGELSRTAEAEQELDKLLASLSSEKSMAEDHPVLTTSTTVTTSKQTRRILQITLREQGSLH